MHPFRALFKFIQRIFGFRQKVASAGPELRRSYHNPIVTPSHYPWESQATFNPAAVYLGGRVHLLYRAMGWDGQSVIGYASSSDGFHFDDRLPYPVFTQQRAFDFPALNLPPEKLRHYRPGIFASGGGWAGTEDPRATVLDGRVYLTYTAFAGWDSVRVAVSSISVEDFLAKRWCWTKPTYLTPHDKVNKNWVLFPEKDKGGFQFLHGIWSSDGKSVLVDTIPDIYTFNPEKTPIESQDPHAMPDASVAWHIRTRSAGPPPIKTDRGWLVFYHAHDDENRNRYQVGAMLLDLADPRVVRHRAQSSVLEPNEWYENDWKPGALYVCGAVVKDDTLFVYYGGGDKHVAVATARLSTFVDKLIAGQTPKLKLRKKI